MKARNSSFLRCSACFHGGGLALSHEFFLLPESDRVFVSSRSSELNNSVQVDMEFVKFDSNLAGFLCFVANPFSDMYPFSGTLAVEHQRFQGLGGGISVQSNLVPSISLAYFPVPFLFHPNNWGRDINWLQIGLSPSTTFIEFEVHSDMDVSILLSSKRESHPIRSWHLRFGINARTQDIILRGWNGPLVMLRSLPLVCSS